MQDGISKIRNLQLNVLNLIISGEPTARKTKIYFISSNSRNIWVLPRFFALGVDESFFHRLPSGVRLPMLQALFLSAESPPMGLFSRKDNPKSLVTLLQLLGRHHLAYLNTERSYNPLGLEFQSERRRRVSMLGA